MGDPPANEEDEKRSNKRKEKNIGLYRESLFNAEKTSWFLLNESMKY